MCCEFLNSDEGGGCPLGVNEAVEEKGGPAGVVDGFKAKLYDCRGRESGVDGGLDENGTAEPDIITVVVFCKWTS